MNYDEKIKELKIKLPEAKPPVGNYVATKISGKMLFVSGQISIDENGQLIKGKVGKDFVDDTKKFQKKIMKMVKNKLKIQKKK